MMQPKTRDIDQCQLCKSRTLLRRRTIAHKNNKETLANVLRDARRNSKREVGRVQSPPFLAYRSSSQLYNANLNNL